MSKPIEPTNRMVGMLAHYGLPRPAVLVETGTYLGNGIRRAIGHFEQIHSIEINEAFARDAATKWSAYPEVTVHHADSGAKLPEMAQQIGEPVLWFLDAHYSGGKTSWGVEADKGWPIVREMQALANRTHDDIIIIDDARMLGQALWSGLEGSEVYPRTHFDFTHLSLVDILLTYGRPAWMTAIRNQAVDWLVLRPGPKKGPPAV